MSLTKTTVVIDEQSAAVYALGGSVSFTPSTDLTDATDGQIIRAVPTSSPLYAGTSSIALINTDNANLSPSGWYYIVTETINGAAVRSYNISLPAALGASVNLAALAPVTAGPAVSTLYGVTAAPNTNTWQSNQIFDGAISYGGVALTAPPGGTTEYWRADGTWATPAGAGGSVNPATTVQPGTAYGTASAVGTDTTYAREDHQHGTVALTSSAPGTAEGIGQAAAVGTATTPARADHVHPTAAAGTPGSSAVGDTASTGVATTPAASDHRHGREAFAAPASATAYGLSAATGSAATVAHSDHTHGTPALTTTAPATTLAIGTAAALGAALLPALADHVHPVAAAAAPTTSAVGDAPATGAATTFAASNHVHGREAFATPGSSAVTDAPAAGTSTSISRADHVHGREGFAAPGNSAVTDAAAAGTSTSTSHADHVHGREGFGAVAATTSVFAVASSNGAAATVARSDHNHGLPATYESDIPSDRGLVEWNASLMLPPSAQQMTSQTIYGATFKARTNATVSKFGYVCSSTASGPVAGENLMGLYSVSGSTWTQVAISGDLGSWTPTAQVNLVAFSASVTVALVPGNTYAVLFLSCATTAAAVRGIGTTASWANGNTTNAAPSWFKYFVQNTSQTALPSSFAASTMTAAGALLPWFALA